MATSLRVVWTAIPTGASAGTLHISVHISPRLQPSASPGHLGAFPEWLHWPSTPVSYVVQVNGVNHHPTVVSPPPRLDLWDALFNSTTPVNPFVYPVVTSGRFYSYPAAFVRDFFFNSYVSLASTSPSDWPTVSQWDQLLSGIPTNDPTEQRVLEVLAGQFPQGGGPIQARSGPSPQFDLEQLKLCLRALTPPTPTSPPPSPPPPNPDFHQALGLISRHPPLARLLGLVVDLTIPLPTASLPNPVSIQVTPTWHSSVPKTGVHPAVLTDIATWRPAARPSLPELAAGQLRLSDTGQYELIEMDLDGATLKMLDFTKMVHSPLRTTQSPGTYAAPSLRSAGLSLARTGAAAALYGDLQGSNALDTTITTDPVPPINLYGEDITQGYRIDVFDETTGAWRQLCARSTPPQPGPAGYLVGSPAQTVPIPEGDEGWIELGLTAPGDGSSGDQFLPETLFGWQGWSLVAPRPGKHLSDDHTSTLQSESYNPPTGAIPLQIAYGPTPGTLPTLRFGHSYRMRARAVDLAGNSVAFSTDTSAASFSWASPSAFYGRLEPVGTPVLVPAAPRTPGEHLERLVIRSNYDIPDTDPSIVPNVRWVAPPVSSVELAEQHGVLDGPSGVPKATLYSTLATKDGRTFATPVVMTNQGGVADAQPLNAGQQWIYYPGSSLTAPYLPDLIARGAAFQFLPGTTAAAPTKLASFGTGTWPDRQLFSLMVKPGSGPPVLPNAANNHKLTVLAPKASITTVRVSSYLNSGDLAVMGLWSWLNQALAASPALKTLILSGQHWMFTPYREIQIVHAVRQPLLTPSLPTATPTRIGGATYATIDATIAFDAPSTQRLDVLAQWTEPFDDGLNPAGSVQLQGNGRVGEIDINLGSPDSVALNAMRHDFGDTKHRNVDYEARATSRFLEYFAEFTSLTLTGTTRATVNPAGLAAGSTVVTDATTNLAYQSGVDYAEDDALGTIARVAGGAMPSPVTVDVQYVVAPVTRSSIEPGATPAPPTPLGTPANIPSSARPLPPEIAYLLPAFEWAKKSTTTTVTSDRRGNTLRVYLRRPWWSSGEDEQLGVIVADPFPGVGLPSQLEPFTTRYGRDPLFASGAVKAHPSISDFSLNATAQKGVLLAEQSGTFPYVDVVGYDVQWDSTHKLWFADILVSPGLSYWPFIRLALVRYQPNSLNGFEVSPVTQADFAQLAPDRAATITFPTTTSAQITVLGPPATDSATSGPPILSAYVEVETPNVTDPDLTWSLTANAVQLTPTVVLNNPGWTGTLTLPAARGSQPMRILVAESEQYPTDSRITYFDTIKI